MDALRSAPLPAAEKLAAIVYINSNCEARSGRQDVMRQLKALLERSNSRLEVHSYGQCDPNMNDAAIADMQAPAGATAKAQKKLQVFRKYRYCVVSPRVCCRHSQQQPITSGMLCPGVSVQLAGCYWCCTCAPLLQFAALSSTFTAMQRVHHKSPAVGHNCWVLWPFCVCIFALQTMENSITRDYVSEKLYDGLVAGCVPIYLGAPNVADYVPDNNAIINYSELGSAHALKAELERLTEDEEAYAAKLAWKTKDIRQWNPGEVLTTFFHACPRAGMDCPPPSLDVLFDLNCCACCFSLAWCGCRVSATAGLLRGASAVPFVSIRG